MSDLRDARLRRALESAPDDHLLPGERTREAIRAAARQAVAPPQPVSWWNKLWQSLGERHTPWNAALATVVLATLVTVLWREREIPGARLDAQPQQPVPAASPPPAAPAPAPEVTSGASPPQPPVATAPVPPAPVRKTAPVGKPQPESRRQPQSQSQMPSQSPAPLPAESQPQPPSARPRAEQAEVAGERRAEAATDSLRDRSTQDMAKSAPAPQAAEASRADVGAAARAPAPAAPAAMARAAPSGLASQREAQAGPSWTHLRIAASGRVVELTRDQAPRLAQLVEDIRRSAPGQQPLDQPVEIRIELTRAGEPAGVIELAGPQVRWTRRSGGRDDSFTARPGPAQLEALREEIGRLLR